MEDNLRTPAGLFGFLSTDTISRRDEREEALDITEGGPGALELSWAVLNDSTEPVDNHSAIGLGQSAGGGVGTRDDGTVGFTKSPHGGSRVTTCGTGRVRIDVVVLGSGGGVAL